MAIEVVAWNVRDALSDPERIPDVLGAVTELNPHVAIFSEAYSEALGLRAGVLEDLNYQGYDSIHGLYDDNDGRQDRHGILAIGRRDVLARSSIISMGTRNAVRLELVDPETDAEVDFFGAHLDDRTEERRYSQALLLLLETIGSSRRIIAGDFNAMHGKSLKAAVLRAARLPVSLLPNQDPVPGVKQSKLSRLGSLGLRLTEMANGSTMELFETYGFRDADPKHQPTKGFAQLDRIMLSQGWVDSFVRHNAVADFDHRAISARIVS